MFSEGVRINRGELKVLKVVTICYHLQFFLFSEAEHEIRRKSISVSANGLIQCFSGNAVSLCKISIYDDFFSANEQNSLLNGTNLDY